MLLFFSDPFFRRFFEGIVPEERQVPIKGLGTSFVFRSDGYILTNEHVVSGADEIKVTFLDGREFEGKVIGSDTLTDIAVVKLKLRVFLLFLWAAPMLPEWENG